MVGAAGGINIITIYNLQHRKNIMVSACPMCVPTAESIDPLLLNCRCTQLLWRSIWKLFDCSGLLPNTLVQLYEAWKMGVGCQRGRKMWKVSFLATIRNIWNERNRHCTEGRSTIELMLADKVNFHVSSWIAVVPRFQDLPIATILSNWKEVGLLFSLHGLHCLRVP